MIHSATARLSWRKLEGFADINTIRGIDYSDSLDYLRESFERIPVQFRDQRIALALEQIADQPPSRAALIEFFVTLYRIGLRGTEVSQDILCKAVQKVTHARRFGVRTLAYAISWAIAEGYLTASWIAIGKRIQIAGEWKTKKIRRYECTYKIRLLVACLRPAEAKKPELITTVGVDPTYANCADNPNGEQAEGRGSVDLPSAMLLRQDKKLAAVGLVPSTDHKEVSPDGDFSTCSPATSPANREHESIKNSLRSHKPKTSACVFRPDVATAPTTYSAARGQLLHDAFVFWKPEPGTPEQFFYNILKTQTFPFYPQYAPAACNWFDIAIPWYFRDWHDRRREMERTIAPIVRSFAAEWSPPPIAGDVTPAYLEDFARWEAALCPPAGIAVRNDRLAEYFAAWPGVRRALSAMFAGRIEPNEDTLTPVFIWNRLILSG